MSREYLLEEYTFNKALYSLSFKERLMIKFGWMIVDPQEPDECNKMTVEELEEALQNIKKPWWNWMFELF